jgi:hypothetical protein
MLQVQPAWKCFIKDRSVINTAHIAGIWARGSAHLDGDAGDVCC